MDHLSVALRDNLTLPACVYEKAKADSVAREKLGTVALWLSLKPNWADDRAHLPIAEVADWFASYVYLPKVKDRIVLELAIRDAVGKLDPDFGYANQFDEVSSAYSNLLWAKSPPEFMPPSALLVRAETVRTELGKRETVQPQPETPGEPKVSTSLPPAIPTPESAAPDAAKIRQFFGSVEIDMVRPIKALETIIEAIVMQLQHSPGAKVKLTLDIEATSPDGSAKAISASSATMPGN